MNKILLLIAFTALLLPSIAFSETITGKVVKVADGDTITILNGHKQKTKIRLYGIDTPASKQAYDRKAKKFTSSLVAGKNGFQGRLTKKSVARLAESVS